MELKFICVLFIENVIAFIFNFSPTGSDMFDSTLKETQDFFPKKCLNGCFQLHFFFLNFLLLMKCSRGRNKCVSVSVKSRDYGAWGRCASPLFLHFLGFAFSSLF